MNCSYKNKYGIIDSLHDENNELHEIDCMRYLTFRTIYNYDHKCAKIIGINVTYMNGEKETIKEFLVESGNYFDRFNIKRSIPKIDEGAVGQCF